MKTEHQNVYNWDDSYMLFTLEGAMDYKLTAYFLYFHYCLLVLRCRISCKGLLRKAERNVHHLILPTCTITTPLNKCVLI